MSTIDIEFVLENLSTKESHRLDRYQDINILDDIGIGILISKKMRELKKSGIDNWIKACTFGNFDVSEWQIKAIVS